MIAFSANASLQIGTGYVMRRLTLADAPTIKGKDLKALCRAHEGSLIEFMRGKGYSPTLEPANAMSRSQSPQKFFHDTRQRHCDCGHADGFVRYPSVLQGSMSAIFLHPNRVQDIDTPDDWESAEFIFNLLQRKKP